MITKFVEFATKRQKHCIQFLNKGLYRVAQKKWNSILPTISAWNKTSREEVTSPEKNDTKISYFGLVVCFLGHILWDNVETQNFHFLA